MNTTAPKLAFSIADMMQMLDVSRPTIYKLINTKRLYTYRIGRRQFATMNDLLKCQDALKEDPTK